MYNFLERNNKKTKSEARIRMEKKKKSKKRCVHNNDFQFRSRMISRGGAAIGIPMLFPLDRSTQLANSSTRSARCSPFAYEIVRFIIFYHVSEKDFSSKCHCVK
ncbi:hypothetical protein TNIN_351681 [Trichonephila inaurata madagascariensis]|uniref:Uncharacterized protein n=1 Tax=Trichonephila inaurata madagascariensis TaxID=2747483 RepID=A0A8X6JQB6_9ARAC|nr:hypothetical protein TNIN_351681 [Trichonephila inaurata madagascariensis]